MVTRAPFLKTRYGGYYHREVPQEDAELTHVGPGTPCGEYMRRFWQPVCFSDELRDLPLRVKILGEELVVFRDQSGAVGLLELHCPHRGTSLEFGLIEAKGIRCCYHGWLFAGDGTILETPGEPMNSTLKDRLYHGVSSLQTLGRPWPDSRTNTWKLLESPRKAIPVGIFIRCRTAFPSLQHFHQRDK
jgi:nitrite reductase/ring-hydroxylating ferredoxin subunit